MNLIDRTPLSPFGSIAQYELGNRSLGLVMGIFEEADVALRTQLLNTQVGLAPQPSPEVGTKVVQVFTSALTGFLTQVRPDQLPSPSMLRHSLTLKDHPFVQDGLDFSDPQHDELMHIAAAVTHYSLRLFHEQRRSCLADFPPRRGLELDDLDNQPVWWSGIADIPQLWQDLLQMDRLTYTALHQPHSISDAQRLRATHFCAAASQLFIEPLRPMTPQEEAEEKRGR